MAIALAAVGAIVVVASCTSSLSSLGEKCGSTSECDEGLLCRAGECAKPEEKDAGLPSKDATADAREAANGDAPADATGDVVSADVATDARAETSCTGPITPPCDGGPCTGGTTCCVESTSSTCISPAVGDCTGSTWACPQPSDCTPAVCCLGSVALSGTCPVVATEAGATACVAACGGSGEYPLCAAQTDCPTGSTCTPVELTSFGNIVVRLCL
jgi:hypothetical protein